MVLSLTSIMRFALRIRDWILSLLSVILLLLVVFWISCFLYGSFYWAYMPSKESWTVDADFAFEVCNVAEKIQGQGKCSFPTAKVPIDNRAFLPGQVYSVRLDLMAPPSPKNYDTGMIMFCGRMLDRESNVVESGCKSAMMPYKNPYLRLMESVAIGPLQLLGFVEMNEKISVELFNDFVGQANRIDVEMRNVDFDFYSPAHLRIHAHFTGLRALMYHHPVFSSFIGVLTCSTFVFSLLYFFWRRFFEPRPATSTHSGRQEVARERIRQSQSSARNLTTSNVEQIDFSIGDDQQLRRRIATSNQLQNPE